MNKWLTPVVDAYQEYFSDTIRPIVWEVGSRDGKDGVELARRIYAGQSFWEDAVVVALEPNPDQAQIIRKRYPNIQVLEVAASNESGVADFIVYEGDAGAVGSSSLNLEWKEDDLQGHIIQVPTSRLETQIDDEIIDIMKIDVESYSLQVLEGLGDKLSQIKVLHVETEEWTKNDKKVKSFLSQRGWKLVDERQEWSGMPDLTWINTTLSAER